MAVWARLRESGCLGGLKVRGGAENVPVESRRSEVASIARSRHGFGQLELEDEADSGAPL